ncbi:hypothetical protein [Paraburkholderia sp. BL25I1N1]|uniref:hypothetical protein n=1 Tax=Paraburkholderia sp. BL25I1N1 TaxID=1938804 RepID=UPI000D0655DE|nr:hypothetical protein [Paraburkholderia sp. BL25I1N1]PRX99399.1 hypothetical protein B0G73_123122 [Paraburkholderia sp. BL25I1N1]
MKLSIAVLFLAIGVAFCAHAEGSISIDPIPTVRNVSSGLNRSLVALRARVRLDAKYCMENAEGMESIGTYTAAFRKTIDTKKIIVIEVSGSMMCDGVHPSSYRYGIAFERFSGERLNLNAIYNIAISRDHHLFLRSELAESAKTSYRRENSSNQSCLANSDWEQAVTNYPITFSPEGNGSISLYYAIPDVSAACFPVLHLERSAVAHYRDAAQAARFDLP